MKTTNKLLPSAASSASPPSRWLAFDRLGRPSIAGRSSGSSPWRPRRARPVWSGGAPGRSPSSLLPLGAYALLRVQMPAPAEAGGAGAHVAVLRSSSSAPGCGPTRATASRSTSPPPATSSSCSRSRCTSSSAWPPSPPSACAGRCPPSPFSSSLWASGSPSTRSTGPSPCRSPSSSSPAACCSRRAPCAGTAGRPATRRQGSPRRPSRPSSPCRARSDLGGRERTVEGLAHLGHRRGGRVALRLRLDGAATRRLLDPANDAEVMRVRSPVPSTGEPTRSSGSTASPGSAARRGARSCRRKRPESLHVRRPARRPDRPGHERAPVVRAAVGRDRLLLHGGHGAGRSTSPARYRCTPTPRTPSASNRPLGPTLTTASRRGPQLRPGDLIARGREYPARVSGSRPSCRSRRPRVDPSLTTESAWRDAMKPAAPSTRSGSASTGSTRRWSATRPTRTRSRCGSRVSPRGLQVHAAPPVPGASRSTPTSSSTRRRGSASTSRAPWPPSCASTASPPASPSVSPPARRSRTALTW